jgi:hemolysin III
MIAQWVVAISGIIFKVVVVDSHRWLTASIYVGMGWMAAIPMPRLFDAMPLWGFIGLVGGGVTYTIGAVVYGLKRPDPWPVTVGFHGIFHILVLLGASVHYAVIFAAVL